MHRAYETDKDGTFNMAAAAMGVKAVVFSSEQDSGLQPLVSDDVPDAMIPISNRPMLFYALYAVLRAHITDIKVVALPPHVKAVTDYVSDGLRKDSAVRALGALAQKARIEVHACAHDADTADTLRGMSLSDASCVVTLGAGYVGAADLGELVACHRRASATCTALLRATPRGANEAPSFAVLDPRSNRLLGLFYRSDLSDGTLHVRGTLLARFPTLRVRSDVVDAGVYSFCAIALQALLKRLTAASSLRFDVVPYLARRQFTLSRDESVASVIVSALVTDPHAEGGPFVERVTDPRTLVAVNASVARGALNPFLSAELPKDKKQLAAALKVRGDKTSVSAECVIGRGVITGARTSIKKSVVGDNVVLGSNVKLNGCTVANNVTVEDGANLNTTFLSAGCTVGERCKLKGCHVAPGYAVPPETEATDSTLTLQTSLEDDDSDLGDDITFE